jgi:uncharacterized protein (DUF58 family)
VRPTALGVKALVFYAVLLAAFFASPYTNLFFLLLAFLGVVLVASPLFAAANLAGIEAELLGAPPCPADSPIALAFRARARRGMRVAIDVELRLDRRRMVVAHLPRLAGERETTAVVPPHSRGVHAVSGAWLATCYPFGLMRCRRPLTAPAALTVHPAVLARHACRDRSAGVGDELLSGAPHGADAGPAGLRDYRPGDALRTVHWKATARRRSLVVRELEDESGPGIEIVLDRRAAGERLERALSVAAMLAVRARETKRPISIASQGLRQTYGLGHAPIDGLLAWLAAADALPADGQAPPPGTRCAVRLPAAQSTEVSG